MDDPTKGEIDLDTYFTASAAGAEAPNGVSVEQLSKVWWIDLDPMLSQKYWTNDRMLRYRRINQHFFYGYFATKKIFGLS